MIGGLNLRHVRVEPHLAQCIIAALVVVFGCACSECPSFFGGDNGNIHTCAFFTTASEGPSTAPTLT